MKIFDKYQNSKNYKLVLVACYLFYFCSVTIKLSYSTLLVEIVGDFSQSKASVGLGLTFYYFVYAVAQIVLSIYITKINFKRFLMATSILSAITFSMITFSSELWQLFLILGLNGVFQCASWGGIMYIISKYFPEDTISYANTLLISCYAIANAIAYGVSAFFVEFFSWHYTFLFWSILFLLSLAFLIFEQKKLESALKVNKEKPFISENLNSKTSIIVPINVEFNKIKFLIAMSIGALIFHVVNYGFTNWIPNLLSETYNFKSTYSILIALGLTLLTVPITVLTYNFLDKTNKVLVLGIILSSITAILLIAITFTYKVNLYYAIILIAVLKLLITGITTVFSSYIAIKLKNHVNGGTTSLIFNSIASIGAGIAPFITGAIMDVGTFKEYYIFLTIAVLLVIFIQLAIKLAIKKSSKLNKYF